jgi:hypothetical protein
MVSDCGGGSGGRKIGVVKSSVQQTQDGHGVPCPYRKLLQPRLWPSGAPVAPDGVDRGETPKGSKKDKERA